MYKNFTQNTGMLHKHIHKTLLIMRLATIILFVSIMQVSAATFAQRITLSEKKTPIAKVFKKISQQSNFDFLVTGSMLKDTKLVTITVKDAELEDVLVAIFKDQPIVYQIADKTVMIQRKEEAIVPKTVNQKLSNLINIQGKIIDRSGQPLPGATIRVKNENNVTTADADGRFSLRQVKENSTLIITMVGYVTQEVNVSGNTDITVQLLEGKSELNEVVVIGYGSVKKGNLTGAVSTVKAKDLNLSTTSNFQQALQGKAAGVQVIQSTGQPGANMSFQIRSNPSFANAGVLYVIDGVPINDAAGVPAGVGRYGSGGVDQSPLNFINPNDIESIDFLKDASSSSIYGARAGAGVVLITTKKGKEGKANVQYTGTYGFQNVDKNYPLLGAKDYLVQRNLILQEQWYRDNKIAPYYGTASLTNVEANNPFIPRYSQEEIDAVTNSGNAIDAITRKGYTQQHNVSLSGGNNKTTYFVSGNYFDQKGIVIGSDYKRYNGRINLEQVISTKVKVGVNLITSNSNTGNVITGGLNENGGIFTAAIYWPPNIPLRGADGNSYPRSPLYGGIPNPLSYGTIDDKTRANRLLTSAFGEYDIIKDLKFRTSFSYDQSNSKRNSYLPTTFYYGELANGDANISENTTNSRLFENTLNYKHVFGGKHNLNTIVGYSYQLTNFEGFNAGNQDFTTDIFKYYNIGTGQSDRPSVGSYKSQNAWASYFARAIYTYDDKYTLQASVRRDGSTKFAVNKKWAVFPSLSGSWLISNESFMENIPVLNYIKLRAGYGETGNSSFSGSAFEQYSSGINPTFGTNSTSAAIYLSQAANVNLTWETAAEINVGLDFGFFKDRLTGSFDYFNKSIRNLITDVPFPADFIVSSVKGNAGETKSRGYEIALQSRNLVANNPNGFSWSSNITFSHYLTFWAKRSPEALKTLQRYISESGTDALFNGIYGYQSEGVFRGEFGTAPSSMPSLLPGSLIIKDIHGYDANGNLTGPDGQITSADATLIGNNDPQFNFGFGNTFKLGNFDLNIYLSGVKQKKFTVLQGLNIEGSLGAYGQNQLIDVKDRFTFANPGGTLPTGLVSSYSSFQTNSTYWLADASFIRCRNITLGYSIPQNLLKPLKSVSSLRISLDFQNAFTITKYPGLDPELNVGNFYPLTKSFVIGINANF